MSAPAWLSAKSSVQSARQRPRLPESDVIPDTLGIRSGGGIGPSGVHVERVTRANMKEARGAFDRTDRCVRAHLKQAQVDS